MKQQADFISRLIDTDDWQITNPVFLFLEDRWRPHSVDCFSTYQKHKLLIFFSRFWNPNSADVDFLFQPIRGENCLLVPAFSINIIPRDCVTLQEIPVPLWYTCCALFYLFSFTRFSGRDAK